MGHDYHLAEVRQSTRRVNNPKAGGPTPQTRYQAQCPACGWVGPERDTKWAADDDAAAHDVTENER